MYESFYGLTDNPFRLVPDARFYFDSDGHKRGMAYLRYGLLQGQGFVVVTGKPGTGKSTLVEALFAEMPERSLVAATLVSTNLDADEILQAVAHCFSIPSESSDSKAGLLNSIEDFLRSQASHGKRVILVVDEAQNLPPKSLEELRMLSNFLLQNNPLIQIILLGQHQLNEMLARPDMEQLCQRVIASCHLGPLSAEQTRAYIAHRLKCAGWRGEPSISSQALSLIFAVSSGVPRLINIFCDRLFLSASLESKNEIDLALAHAVHEELKGESTGSFCGLSFNERDQLIELDSLPGADFAIEAGDDQYNKESQPEEPTENAAEAYDENSGDFAAATQPDEVESEVVEHKFVEEQLSALSALAAEKIEAYEIAVDKVKADEVKSDEIKADEVKADEVKADEVEVKEVAVDNENAVVSLQEQLSETESSPALQVIHLEPGPVHANPGPLTSGLAYKEIKFRAISEASVTETHHQSDKLEEILKNYPLPQHDEILENNKTESSNRSLIWPIVFVGAAMATMFYFSDDVREFSQRYKFPTDDSIDLVGSPVELNSSQEDLGKEETSEQVFVQQQPQIESEIEMMSAPVDESSGVVSQVAEVGEDEIQLDAPANVEAPEAKAPAAVSGTEVEGLVSTEAQVDVAPEPLAAAESESDMQTSAAVNPNADVQQAPSAMVEEAKPKAVVPVVASKVEQTQAKSAPKSESNEIQKTPASAKESLPAEKVSSKTLAAAKPETVEQASVQKPAALVVKEEIPSVNVIIPKFDDAPAGEVLPAKIESDLKSENLKTAAVVDIPPVVEMDVVNAEITEFELTNLLYDLVAYYESGDLSGFVDLFTDDVVVDGVEGRDRLRQDYRALFDATDMRQMQLDVLQWEYLPEHVQGHGEFAVTVWRKRGRPSTTQEGVLKLGIVKRGDVLAIKTMAHELK